MLEQDVRKKLSEIINEKPGINYTQLMEKLQLSNGVLVHHLNILEREEIIKSKRDGLYRRFYPIGFKPVKKLEDLTSIQKSIWKKIKENPGVHQSKIAQMLGVSRQVVNYHLNILLNAGFIQVKKTGKTLFCYVKQ